MLNKIAVSGFSPVSYILIKFREPLYCRERYKADGAGETGVYT